MRTVLAVLCLAVNLIASPASAERVLLFGTYTADKPTETVRKYGPFLAFLSEKLSDELGEPIRIKMKIDKDYDAAIENLAIGAVDFARFGPASYVTVKGMNPGVQIIAMESRKGQKRFNGVVAVHNDSTIDSLSDLSGQSFAFGDELSTIGRYLAQSHLLDAGINSSELSSFQYLGRHDIVGEAVGAGKFTAGALKESTFEKLVGKGVPIKALIKFDNVTKPWLASSTLSPEIAEHLSSIMLDDANYEAVKSVAKSGFLAGSDADYDFVRRAMAHSQAF
ncbi:MAG: PhnD/SsuA/transferrin family substrate-binding protein [Rhodobacteraceae bacterium]|nr:PhnD/SsuA/transferrin family substrate-binding protein [Paracoccaceae bacterium]